jgi:hypothetical protein
VLPALLLILAGAALTLLFQPESYRNLGHQGLLVHDFHVRPGLNPDGRLLAQGGRGRSV